MGNITINTAEEFRFSNLAFRAAVTPPEHPSLLSAGMHYPYSIQMPTTRHILQVTPATMSQWPSLSGSHKFCTFSLGVSLLCSEAGHGSTHAWTKEASPAECVKCRLLVAAVTRYLCLAGEEWRAAEWTGRTSSLSSDPRKETIEGGKKRKREPVYLCNRREAANTQFSFLPFWFTYYLFFLLLFQSFQCFYYLFYHLYTNYPDVKEAEFKDLKLQPGNTWNMYFILCHLFSHRDDSFARKQWKKMALKAQKTPQKPQQRGVFSECSEPFRYLQVFPLPSCLLLLTFCLLTNILTRIFFINNNSRTLCSWPSSLHSVLCSASAYGKVIHHWHDALLWEQMQSVKDEVYYKT